MIRKLIAILAAWLALIAPAYATTLLNLPITTAITTTVAPVLQLRAASGRITIQCNFTYVASAATSVSAWIQTSLDGGVTWTDVAQCGFTTSSVREVVNLFSDAPAAVAAYTAAAVVPFTAVSDGSMAANTALNGVIGSVWRVKYSSVGTYGAGTTLRIDAVTTGLTGQ